MPSNDNDNAAFDTAIANIKSIYSHAQLEQVIAQAQAQMIRVRAWDQKTHASEIHTCNDCLSMASTRAHTDVEELTNQRNLMVEYLQSRREDWQHLHLFIMDGFLNGSGGPRKETLFAWQLVNDIGFPAEQIDSPSVDPRVVAALKGIGVTSKQCCVHVFINQHSGKRSYGLVYCDANHRSFHNGVRPIWELLLYRGVVSQNDALLCFNTPLRMSNRCNSGIEIANFIRRMVIESTHKQHLKAEELPEAAIQKNKVSQNHSRVMAFMAFQIRSTGAS